MTNGQQTARRQALNILLDVFERGAYSNLAMQSSFRSADPRDASLIKQLVFGTVTYRLSLDYLLSQWLDRPLESLDSKVRAVLRLGLYQVIYLGIPDHAAVSESVKLARSVSHRGAAGLVNAILRRAVREKARLPWPRTTDRAFDLSIRYSYPEWMVRRWLDRLGPEQAEAFCRVQNQAPGIDLRVNSLCTTLEGLLQELAAEGMQATPHPLVAGSIRISGGSLPSIAALSRGECTVQGAASTLVGLVVDPQPDELVYDLCAAPGGKAMHLAELMSDKGQVVAVDNHPGRLALIAEAATRLHITSVQPVQGDARDVAKQQRSLADRVLVDAPCSGMGVIRRKPDIRWHRSLDDIKALQVIQEEILGAAASLVRPGGVLVYSVCSTEPEETTAVVARFLDQHPDFSPADWPKRLPQALLDQVSAGQLTTYPHQHELDGFFICRMMRREGR